MFSRCLAIQSVWHDSHINTDLHGVPRLLYQSLDLARRPTCNVQPRFLIKNAEHSYKISCKTCSHNHSFTLLAIMMDHLTALISCKRNMVLQDPLDDDARVFE